MIVGARAYKDATCRISIAEGLPEDMRDGSREVVAVESSNPKKGHATALMHQVCMEADVGGVLLILMPKPFGDSGMTEAQLEKWYSRFGFVMVQTEPAKLMARQPVIRKPRLVVAH